jgi:dUTP pyrophosphatase
MSLSGIGSTLLNIYGRFMRLKIYVDDETNNQTMDAYINAVNQHNNKIINNPHMIDAGFDILTPAPQVLTNKGINKVDFKIICACEMVTTSNKYNTGFYMYPRSSISKTPLRLANNTGIIDAGYRGHLIGMFDLIQTQTSYEIKELDRYLQICAPNLVPILVELVKSKNDLGEETQRGDGGFGSTGR